MIRISSIFKLLPTSWTQNSCGTAVKLISTAGFPLEFQTTPSLWAEPLKKKKRIDPNVIRLREERKKKKIEKRIRQLKKLSRHCKPIEENETPYVLIDELEKRQREPAQISEEVQYERIKLLKEWAKARHVELMEDYSVLRRLMQSQEKALKELRLESEELYQAAVKMDPNLVPFTFIGPNKTPPKENYLPPDGDFFDISKKWL